MSRINYLSFKICECNKTANGFLFRSKLTSSLQTLSSADWDSLNENVWQGSQIPLTKTEYFSKIVTIQPTQRNKMSKSNRKTSSKTAPVFNYLEKWDTRFGTSERVVTRQNGKFVTNVSLTALRKAPRIK